MEKVYEIWAEGAHCQEGIYSAHFWGRIEAESFKDACDKFFAAQSPRIKEYYDKDECKFWGCRLFDNEADARKLYG